MKASRCQTALPSLLCHGQKQAFCLREKHMPGPRSIFFLERLQAVSCSWLHCLSGYCGLKYLIWKKKSVLFFSVSDCRALGNIRAWGKRGCIITEEIVVGTIRVLPCALVHHHPTGGESVTLTTPRRAWSLPSSPFLLSLRQNNFSVVLWEWLRAAEVLRREGVVAGGSRGAGGKAMAWS